MKVLLQDDQSPHSCHPDLTSYPTVVQALSITGEPITTDQTIASKENHFNAGLTCWQK